MQKSRVGNILQTIFFFALAITDITLLSLIGYQELYTCSTVEPPPIDVMTKRFPRLWSVGFDFHKTIALHNVYIVQFFPPRPSAVGRIVQPHNYHIIEHIFVPTRSVEGNIEKNSFQWVSNSNLAKISKFSLLNNFETGPKKAYFLGTLENQIMVNEQLLEKDRDKISQKVPYFFLLQGNPTVQCTLCAVWLILHTGSIL